MHEREFTAWPVQGIVGPMFISILTWLVVLELLGLAAYPLMRRVLAGGVESAFAASKVAGLVLFGTLAWCANWFFHLPLSGSSLWLLLSAALLGSYVIYRKEPRSMTLRQELSAAKRVQFLYLGIFLFFLVFRSLQPEIFWGEKPMDFTLLNYFIRMTELPPQEPWAAGLTLNYYYLGFFFFSLLHKLTAVDSAIGFNLAVVTLGALIATTSVTLLLELGVRARMARLGAVAITLLSNWEVLRLFWMVGQRAGFDLFWASSRLFTSPAFSEYPLWSILFADLHAHVMAIPVAVLSAALAVAAMPRIRDGGGALLPTIHGVVLGALYGTNAWDCLSQGGLLVGLLGAALVLFPQVSWPRRLARAGEYLLIVALSAVVIVIPFRASMGPGPAIEFGWVLGEFNTTSQVVRYLGQWIVPLGLAVLAVVVRLSRNAQIRYDTFAAALLVGAAPLVLGEFVAQKLQGQSVPWGLIAVLSAGLFCATVTAACRELSMTQRTGAVLFAGALCMVTLVELVFLMDRMNTIFKFYIPIWFLCGASFFALLPGLGQRSGCIGRVLSASAITGSVFAAAAGTVINLWGMARFHRIEEAPRPTVDGMAYHASQSINRHYLLQWMRQNITGQPTIIEAFGNSYGAFARIAMNTGLPTVLGWEYHLIQRGVRDSEIQVRKAAIRDFYSTADVKRAQQILAHYRIAFVVVGDVEREGYRNGAYLLGGLQKFSQHPELFRPVFQSGGEVLYATPYARMEQGADEPSGE